ncbi:MAG TPA: SGNH/GDSL hydrolase family protein, partial [Pseudomonadales bacterium]|nr:SGNH/GDSL hydrolase family protein [Pseudomonadales bacterium]
MTDEALHPLLQASKKNIFPSHYIALFGDSYAAGMGDWATEAMNKPMARYSSADLLHEATGMDVVSFGSAGAGSVRGIVTEPVTQLTYLRKYINVQLESPEWVLIYFYEGNDLYDNAAYFHYSFPKLFDIDKQFN